jgi:RNA polymerase sigma-70 factor (ECF subfamily)
MTLDRRPEESGTPPKKLGDQAELTARLLAGDASAEEEFVRRHAPRMLTVARRYFRCEQDQADAVQEAFITAFRGIGNFSGQSKLSTWLHRIVINACLMKLRSQRSRPSLSIDDLLPQFDQTGHYADTVTSWSDGAPARLASSEMRGQVRACIDQLPEAYRTVLLLRDIEQYDTQETANLLGDTTTNVKTRLHRARQALRTLLEPLGEPA